MIPLLVADLGRPVKIAKCEIEGDLKRHVDNLGLIPGEEIIPVSRTAGSLIIKIKESRFAIHMGLAAQIYVN